MRSEMIWEKENEKNFGIMFGYFGIRLFFFS